MLRRSVVFISSSLAKCPIRLLSLSLSLTLTLTYPLADLDSVYIMCPDRDYKASNQITLEHQHEKNITLVSKL